jgi:hypothetical protein
MNRRVRAAEPAGSSSAYFTPPRCLESTISGVPRNGEAIAHIRSRQEDGTMTRTALRLTMAAAAILASAGLVSAQSMKAEIPFAFHVGTARFLPGTYQVHVTTSNGARKLVQVYSVETRRSVMAAPGVTSPRRPSESALAVFVCSEGRCELAGVKGLGGAEYTFARSKIGPATRIAEVVLKPDRAD